MRLLANLTLTTVALKANKIDCENNSGLSNGKLFKSS